MLISISEINCPMSQDLTWSEMKVRNAALLFGDHRSHHGHEALIDFGAQFGVAGQRLACRYEHAQQILLQHLRLA